MMNEADLKKSLNDLMTKTIQSYKNALLKVRTGRASASLLQGLKVMCYGQPTPIEQLAQISTPEARLLQLRPFDKTLIPDIEKAILAANIGPMPSNDGNLIRLPFPPLTEDKRKELVKQIKKMSEETKVAIRNIRRDENEKIKKVEKSKEISEDQSKKWQTEVQTITDKFIKEVDDLTNQKEKELLTI